ncbi:MAG TPA: TonB family protein [Longimicrobium sp.]|jgi:serine/threonine-protein kinase|uniref:TonB family protein n=1 Tax=Longimicrobium sp. TaxID=2029185 RepID=UPI002EDA5639
MSSSAVLSPGLVVAGRYRIEETLAGEGSAALLRATDTRAERGVVLRMLPLGGGDDGERCTRQGKLAARLTHPNLARVLDFGTDEAAGVRYVAAEFGAGGTLAALLAQRGAPPLPLALRMLQEAAAGLAAAHAAGAVHGDLHPGMLWLSRGGGKLRVEVLGLGMDAAGAPPARATARYCSPERLRRARDLAVSADVFSLGAIAYEVLAGLPADWMSLLVAMAKGQPAAVPSPLTLKPGLPPELAEAVLRAVSPAPGDRWCDAGEFAAALAVPVAAPAAPTIIPLAINVVREPAPEPRAEAPRFIPLAVPIVAAPADVLPAPAEIVAAAETLPVLELVPAASPLEIVHADASPPVEVAPVAAVPPAADAAPAEPAPATGTDGGATLSHEVTLASSDLADSLYIPPAIVPAAQAPAPGLIADVEPAAAIAVPQPAMESAVLDDDPAVEFELTLIDAEDEIPTLLAAAPIAEPAVASAEPEVIDEDGAAAQSVPLGFLTVLPASEAVEPKRADRIAPQPADRGAPSVPVTPIVRYGRPRPNAQPTGGRRGLIAAGVVLAVLVAGGGLVAKTAMGGSSTDAAAARLASPALAAASSAASTAAPSTDVAAPAVEEPKPTTDRTAAAADEERRRAEEKRKQDQLRRDQQRRADSIRAAQLASARQAAAQAAPAPIQPPAPVENRPVPQVAVAPPPAAAAPAPSAPARPRVDPSRVYRAGELDEAPALANRADFGRVVARNYPSSASGAGSAVVQFVVLPNGTVDRSSIRVLEVSDPVFRRAATAAAGAARFTPARVDGQPVRATVSIPLTWNQN